MADRPDFPRDAVPLDRRRLTVADQALVNIVMWWMLSRLASDDWRELFRLELADLLPEVAPDNPDTRELVAAARRIVAGEKWPGWDGEMAASEFLKRRAVLAAQAARDAAGRDPTKHGA